jgi:hypothetical protein
MSVLIFSIQAVPSLRQAVNRPWSADIAAEGGI